jgi:hypothetical protein
MLSYKVLLQKEKIMDMRGANRPDMGNGMDSEMRESMLKEHFSKTYWIYWTFILLVSKSIDIKSIQFMACF